MKIYLTAIITAKPEYRTGILEALQDMVKQTRKEAACECYRLHQDLEDENRFVFYEIWSSAEGLEEHNRQPYIKAFGGLRDQLQEQPRIYKTAVLEP
ncbi:putative quinol monooxygenase [Niabella beijingensis]|uniref:putative quinol monooxygenase n=1 Tax=Niabella beijingensis TaxID=2872700 RepID=UPI001CC17964|nr:putative quinol monooxygenase [Niabella beijingensis]MBZ4191845.1 antibiotic biosynthesis monooxygenase [Niabella beijingensis]